MPEQNTSSSGEMQMQEADMIGRSVELAIRQDHPSILTL